MRSNVCTDIWLVLSVVVLLLDNNVGCCNASRNQPSTTTSCDVKGGVSFRPNSHITTRSSHIQSKVIESPKKASDDSTATSSDVSVLQQRGGAMRKTTTTAKSTNVRMTSNGLPKAIAGAMIFAMIEQFVKITLRTLHIQYPAQLGACIVLFVLLCGMDMIAPSTAFIISTFLSPGAALLAKWFPIFFIPGLVLLPLSPPIGGAADILKILATVIIGFVFSLSSTLLGVTTVRTLQGRSPPKVAVMSKVAKSKVVPTTSGSPFSESQWNFCRQVTIVSGILNIIITKVAAKNVLASPLQMLYTFFFTISAYIWGSRLPTAFVKLCHPLVTSSVLLLGLIRALAFVTNRDFLQVLASYKTGTLSPLRAGAGDYLLYLLGPGVVAFAVSVYGKRSLLFSNLPMVLTAMTVSSVGGLFATGAFVRLIQLGGPNGSLVRLSVLARNVTMALAMALTDMIGGDVAIIALVVCLTGIIGASYGIPLLDAMGVTDPICRGLGIGSSAQGLGVASIAAEPDAFAFASVAMVLTAVAGTTIVSFPAVRNALIQVTTGHSP